VIDGLRRSFGGRAPKAKAGEPVVKTLIESFRYPRRGPGMMWEACARKVQALGSEVVMDRKATGLRWDAASSFGRSKPRTPPGRATSTTPGTWSHRRPYEGELLGRSRPTPLSLIPARSCRYRDYPDGGADRHVAPAISLTLGLHPRIPP
jgi:hypothetical protein